MRTTIGVVSCSIGAASAAEEPAPGALPDRVVSGWPTLPGTITFGQVSAVATDSADRVFVFHRGEPPIVVFDRDGKFLRSWGDGLVKKAARAADRSSGQCLDHRYRRSPGQEVRP